MDRTPSGGCKLSSTFTGARTVVHDCSFPSLDITRRGACRSWASTQPPLLSSHHVGNVTPQSVGNYHSVQVQTVLGSLVPRFPTTLSLPNLRIYLTRVFLFLSALVPSKERDWFHHGCSRGDGLGRSVVDSFGGLVFDPLRGDLSAFTTSLTFSLPITTFH